MISKCTTFRDFYWVFGYNCGIRAVFLRFGVECLCARHEKNAGLGAITTAVRTKALEKAKSDQAKNDQADLQAVKARYLGPLQCHTNGPLPCHKTGLL